MIKNKILGKMIMITMLLILFDQISKMVIKSKYEKPIENPIIGIKLIENTGVAFGLHSGNTKNIVLTLLILLLMIHFIKLQKDRIETKTAMVLSLILAGGISNLIDRIFRGGVVDFIEIKHFAIFNMADCYIVLGWVLWIVFLIKWSQQKSEW